ncbi:phosphatidylinositol 3,4,5-trisphosphate 3-phosphatase and protein-tyrosine-phosphatase PTEN2A-like [Cucurbita moschata]|uniref:Phosphatidylinositol 3,4,5-trisphosphate 3-phosphatase and protein-tyrosine-phosphatase PTEN2A-like n=1 Tax=Cucurbita moschata TaxID=3662 RepID=A0A6J1EJ55_CUCMO|nr:phosphatidylinositol 3,4,5-trisphosphate 3-phosphatase and protein-tyrosine-phosphatase PTEN2A-like [Cucurbita moschata]
MDPKSTDSPPSPTVHSSATKFPEVHPQAPASSGMDNVAREAPSKLSSSGITSWAKNLKISQPQSASPDATTENAGKSAFARFTSGFGLNLSPKSAAPNDSPDASSKPAQPSLVGSFTRGLVDSSKSAVKAVQVKARHVVSQNKRRYQEGGFDLDMTYITENIIAMGFPAGDMSSGFFGYVEGFYRNHMEEVIKFFETHHKGKYKVYNLCSERLYDASLFEGKVACFPFDDHNCPPVQLIISFCQSAYSWLKDDIENVVVVHCKAGMARTGLMISSLLLFLKFFPTAEESIEYYNQRRCFDGKGLVLPSQIRYVKYFERILTYFNGENPPGRSCVLRGFRLHRCPYWIRPSITVSDHNGVLFSTKTHQRTKNLSPEDFWFTAPKKGIMVFALPGEPGLAELCGDFKVHFHDRQGDFYCWLNTTMTENRKMLYTNDLDGFDKRKLPSPGFQVEVVLVDMLPNVDNTTKKLDESSGSKSSAVDGSEVSDNQNRKSLTNEKDDVFSDSESEGGSAKSKDAASGSGSEASAVKTTSKSQMSATSSDDVASLSHATKQVSLGDGGAKQAAPAASDRKGDGVKISDSLSEIPNSESEFKAMAADASVFTFGDDEDYESE